MTKEEIYARMADREFEDGKPCAELYDRVYHARRRLAERTAIDFEDGDLLEIIESMEKIAKLCGLAMYDQGVRYAAQ